MSEKEAQIVGMQRQIEVLSRKADKGSQQLQGEALELELERSPRERFPRDILELPQSLDRIGQALRRFLDGPHT